MAPIRSPALMFSPRTVPLMGAVMVTDDAVDGLCVCIPSTRLSKPGGTLGTEMRGDAEPVFAAIAVDKGAGKQWPAGKDLFCTA